ncbi:MAG TPA: hypothetical protein VM764_06820 [Gemmatimonadaceae bacterium]|nr:hypothetical protein [Gemmatimonadaceae bacterium]
MTATTALDPSAARVPASGRSYAYAHWYFLAALGAIVAGFWPSFFLPLGTGDFAHSLHGITATLWIVALITQSYLMSRGLVTWHRRVAWGALLLLPVLAVSALHMVKVMFGNAEMPPFLPPLLAFIDLPSVAFLLVLVTLALRNVRTPAAHKRFMAATVLVGFPPALTRLYARVFAPQVDFMGALHGSFFTVELILVALIIADRRAGERRLAYPLSLAFFVVVHALMMPVAGSATWRALMDWYVALPIFA